MLQTTALHSTTPHSTTPHSTDSLPGLDALTGWALSVPLTSFALAVVVTLVVVLVRPGAVRAEAAHPEASSGLAPRGVGSRHGAEHRTIGVVAVVLIAGFLVVDLVMRYVLRLDGVVSWWRYAAPVAAAAVGLVVLLVVIGWRGTTPPEHPVSFVARRSWGSFGPRLGLWGSAAALLVLVTTTVLAGLASSSVHGGPSVFLEIPAPNTDVDPVRLWFYGWAYGVPVLIASAVLVLIGIAVLHVNAARPYLRPGTVATEQRERRSIATGAVRIATAGMLLALAGAWRLIGDAASPTRLTVEGEGTYDLVSRSADIARTVGAVAPVVEIGAFVLLLLTAAHLRGAPRIGRARTPSVAPVGAEVVR